jgi:hypothetical protein
MRYFKGIETLKGAQKIAELQALATKYYKPTSQLASLIRSSATESALMARSTQERTYAELVNKFIEDHEREPNAHELKYFREKAKTAGNTAYYINTPLVGFSNLVGLPKLLQKNMKLNTVANRLKGTTRLTVKDGVVKSAADSKLAKAWGFTKATAIPGITEAFEEGAQGVLEEGLLDYHINNNLYSKTADQISFLGALKRQTMPYLKTTEGQDSLILGGLMGLVGMPMPIKTDVSGKKIKLGFEWHGGAQERIRELNKNIAFSRQTAENLNNNPSLQAYFQSNSNTMKSNMDHMMAHTAAQKIIDEEMSKDNPNYFKVKNAEHDQLYSLLKAKHEQGLEDILYKELDDMESMPLDVFNKNYAPKDMPFTEEDRKEQVNKVRKKAKQTFKEFKKVDNYIEYNSHKYSFDKIDKLLAKEKDPKTTKEELDAIALTKKKIVAQKIKEAYTDLLYQLHSTSLDADKRINTLNGEIADILDDSNIEVISDFLTSRGILKASDIELTDEGDITTGEDLQMSKSEQLKDVLKRWKESDPDGFNKYSGKVKHLFKDIINLKSRKKAAGEFIHLLETDKGFKKFAKFEKAILDQVEKDTTKASEEYIKEQQNNTNNAKTAGTAQEDEFSITGDTKNSDENFARDTINGIQKYKEEIQDKHLTPDEMQEALRNILDGNPRLFTIIKNRLKGRNIDLGVGTIEELINSGMGEGLSLIHNELLKIIEEFNAAKNVDFLIMEEKAYAPVPSNKEGDIDHSKLTADNSFEGQVEKGNMVTEGYTIPVSKDKEFRKEKGKTVLVYEKKGKVLKPKNDDNSTKEDWITLPNEILNAPEFMNNSDLEDRNHEVIFKVSNNVYNVQKGYVDQHGNVVNPEMVAINIYFVAEDGQQIMVGRLPAVNETNNAEQLRALREAVTWKHDELIQIDGKLSEADPKFAKKKEKLIELIDELRNTPEDDVRKSRSLNKRILKLESEIDALRQKGAFEALKLDDKVQELSDKKEKLKEERAAITKGKKPAPTAEELVEEVKENQTFIKGLTADGRTVDIDSGEEYIQYINTKTGKTYTRATQYANPSDVDTTEPLIASSIAIGNKTDRFIRDFFAGEVKPYAEYGLAEDTIMEEFEKQLAKIDENLKAKNERVISNNIILYDDALGIAGTVDLLTIDDKGNVRIYDIKTKRRGIQYIESENFGKSDMSKWTDQLSLYKILLNNTHGITAKTLAVLPIKVMYEPGDTTTSELKILKGISIPAKDEVHDAKLIPVEKEESPKRLEEIQAELKEINKQLKEITPTLDTKSAQERVQADEENSYVASKEILEQLDEATESEKRELEADLEALEEKIGKEKIERVGAIEENFDAIIEQIAARQINIFQNKEGNVKKCY